MTDITNHASDKLIWKSGISNRQDEAYLSVKQTPQGYTYSERAGVNSVAFCLFDGDKSVGLLYHPHACTGDFSSRSFTGGIDDYSKTVMDITLDELKEECGYRLPEREISARVSYYGKYATGTQTNEYVYLYGIDVSGIEQGELELSQMELTEPRDIVWEPINPLSEWFYSDDWKVEIILAKHILTRRLRGKRID